MVSRLKIMALIHIANAAAAQYMTFLCTSNQNIIHGNMNQFHEVSNGTHHYETNTNSLGDLDEFALVGLCAPVQEKGAIAEKVFRDLHELLNLVRHFE